MRRFINDFFEPICIYLLDMFLINAIKSPMVIIYALGVMATIMAILIGVNLWNINKPYEIEEPSNIDVFIAILCIFVAGSAAIASVSTKVFLPMWIMIMSFGVARLASILSFREKESNYEIN